MCNFATGYYILKFIIIQLKLNDNFQQHFNFAQHIIMRLLRCEALLRFKALIIKLNIIIYFYSFHERTIVTTTLFTRVINFLLIFAGYLLLHQRTHTKCLATRVIIIFFTSIYIHPLTFLTSNEHYHFYWLLPITIAASILCDIL